MMMNRYRSFTPAVFGRGPDGAPAPTAQLRPWDQVIPTPQPMQPQQQSGPSLGQAVIGGGSQIIEALKQRRQLQQNGTAVGSRFGTQMASILGSLGEADPHRM